MSQDPHDHDAERRRSLEAYEPPAKVIRASDADRERAVAQLRQHLSDGRLTLEEFTERVDEAYAARTTADIERALRELPHISVRGSVPAGFGPVAASRRHDLQQRRNLRSSLVGYAAINAMLLLIWLVTCIATGDLQYFWPIWPMLGMGIGVIAQAWKLYGGQD
jgi:hypothetical protein